jgi:hypothetical protein
VRVCANIRSLYIDTELESLLQLAQVFDDEAMQALGFQRSVAVNASVARKDLPLYRLFLAAVDSGKAAVKADAKAGNKPDSQPDTKWVPRADLNIAM